MQCVTNYSTVCVVERGARPFLLIKDSLRRLPPFSFSARRGKPGTAFYPAFIVEAHGGLG